MPARVYAWEPEEQWTSSEEREKKIEELSRELDESIDGNCLIRGKIFSKGMILNHMISAIR